MARLALGFVVFALAYLVLSSNGDSFPHITDLVAFGDSYTDEGRRKASRSGFALSLLLRFLVNSRIFHWAPRTSTSCWIRSPAGRYI
jgi:hypothetical protein